MFIEVMEHSSVRDYYQDLNIPIELYENFSGNVEFNSTHKDKVLYNYWFDMVKKDAHNIKKEIL